MKLRPSELWSLGPINILRRVKNSRSCLKSLLNRVVYSPRTPARHLLILWLKSQVLVNMRAEECSITSRLPTTPSALNKYLSILRRDLTLSLLSNKRKVWPLSVSHHLQKSHSSSRARISVRKKRGAHVKAMARIWRVTLGHQTSLPGLLSIWLIARRLLFAANRTPN